MKKINVFILTAIAVLGITGCSDNSSITSSVTSEEATSFESSEITSGEISEVSSTEDPYYNVSYDEFYENYTPATSYEDSVWRTLHYYMSGSIEEQTLDPIIANPRPKSDDDKYILNSTLDYITDGDGENVGYNLVDCIGNVVDTIYLGGGYTDLDEVCAYLYAFGEAPSNYQNGWSRTERIETWGNDYCVNNFAYFSDDYSGEADLIDNYGGDIGTDNKRYFEMDVKTNGEYQDGTVEESSYSTSNRGCARIVFTYEWSDETHIEEASERHVFYTYDHYDTFTEFLNYDEGFGEKFGQGCSSFNYVYTAYEAI